MYSMKKLFLFLLVLVSLPLCLFPAGLAESCASDPFFTESYTCGEAALMLCINADAYSDPAPTVGEILGGLSPHTPLTRVEGCRMILRAFGPLPDVQEGIRYLVKYRDCAFEDVPWYGEAAVRNLTDAGLYIPEDDTVFGPCELMTEHELFLLVDRIHAYLQSSPRDDYYSWATADLVNDPGFFPGDYTYVQVYGNGLDSEIQKQWIMDLLNECLENPDTPEKANIAALFSTYMDIEEHENSMTYIMPMVDAIWNAADFDELMDVCADICRETGIELLLTRNTLDTWRDDYTMDERGRICPVFSTGKVDIDPRILTPGNYVYDEYMEQGARILSRLGFGAEEIRTALANCLDGIYRQTLCEYESSTLPMTEFYFRADDVPEELSGIPLSRYLERAGYGNARICFSDLAYAVSHLSVMSRPENLTGIKADTVVFFIRQLTSAIPLRMRDAALGFWDDHFATEPERVFGINQLTIFMMPLIQTDVALYYSTTEEFALLHEKLGTLCDDITAYYREMLESSTWLDVRTRRKAVSKLNSLHVELLVPSDYSDVLHVDYISAEDGGTMMENICRYMKARREFLFREHAWNDPSVQWSLTNLWYSSQFYLRETNTYYLPLPCYIGNEAMKDDSLEALLAYVGFSIAHEISHGFDFGGSFFNGRGDYEEWWTSGDMAEFIIRILRLADYLGGYEYIPGLAEEDGSILVDEGLADLTAMKCMMRIASETPGFDYAYFFRCFAEYFSLVGSRLGFLYILQGDEHPIGRARINLILSLIDEFYTTFDVHEGDAMYVAPEDRPYVW